PASRRSPTAHLWRGPRVWTHRSTTTGPPATLGPAVGPGHLLQHLVVGPELGVVVALGLPFRAPRVPHVRPVPLDREGEHDDHQRDLPRRPCDAAADPLAL